MVDSLPGAGPNNAITDIAGVTVGHQRRLDERWATGSTAVLTPAGAAGAVDVRGAGPGTRETDVLAPENLVRQVHGIVLGGGSAYGLSAADGVMRWLAERGHGVPVGPTPHEVVPVVPAAVLFDLPMSDWGRRPDATFGYAACEARTAGHPGAGNVGAGTGAVAGAIKGGLGTASSVLADGTRVGALLAVNSSGTVIDPATGLPWALDSGLEGEFDLPRPSPETVDSAARRTARPDRAGNAITPLNTTIGVVATDAGFGKSECRRIAVAAHDGLARAIRPAHGMTDGDTVFALATGERTTPAPGEPRWLAALDEVCTAAAQVTARAIVHAVLAAGSVGAVPCYTRLYHPERE
ncbi:L-aminopeptidase/D-esterase [Actinopolyspora mzabensis]|uniref:L-aminopeptidase/D-esterase n=1 Tax=Actinopolyspora mzabensis TaxID=995066 RepID=A0A1G9FNB6_ACTMZ|nr:P1 family peptidase [Actinopolyspora mzabensis]SDK89673.1 L-aminopeptidase/D-esterase [Actinopolyspora mzabensis]